MDLLGWVLAAGLFVAFLTRVVLSSREEALLQTQIDKWSKEAADSAIARDALTNELVHKEEELSEAKGDADALRFEMDELTEQVRRSQLPVPVTPLTEEQRQTLLATKCVHCGGIHETACPRVKRMRMRTGGEPMEVEFWADADWPKDNIIWPADIQ